jgi:hypothetical protein
MYDRDKNEKEISFARRVIESINMVEEPKLVYKEEKEVVKKALQEYIRKLEEQQYFYR